MSKKLVELLNDIDEKYILESQPKTIRYYNHSGGDKKESVLRWSKKVVVAAIIIVALCSGINTVNPTFAQSIPFIGNVFAYLQESLDFSGTYSDYNDEIGFSVTDNGVTITISEIYCDGYNLVVSYRITSEEKFADDSYIQTQLDYSATSKVITSEETWELSDVGVAGLEGEFLDEYTFIGVETYLITEEILPETFELEIDIRSVAVMGTDIFDDYSVRGTWDFLIPVTTNTEDVVIMDIYESNQGYTIDQLVVSPIIMTLYTSYTEQYSESFQYELIVLGDQSDIDIIMQGVYNDTDGITKIPRSSTEEVIDIYLVDRDMLYELYEEYDGPYTREMYEACAIVHQQVELVE